MIKKYIRNHFSRKTIVAFSIVIKKTKIIINHLLDVLLSPLIILSAIIFRYVKKNSFIGFGIAKRIMLTVGIYPVLDHYYEPLFNRKYLRHSLRDDRNLPAIDFNDKEQLQILEKFDYTDELLKFPLEKNSNERQYSYNEGAFLSGDAEYLYNMIRLFKPKKIIEIGSGNSTMMAENAIKANCLESAQYRCEHICIEPYEMQWLSEIGVSVVRKKVEEVDISLFKELSENDILFIDSSHIIRPQGDVLFEYLEILPILKKGVIIHVHDIFTPKDYLDEWFGQNFWNEQYLLEAFLSFNENFRIIGATNYLSHKYYDLFSDKCPVFAKQKGREPGSFWIIRN